MMDDALVLGIIWYAVFLFSATFHEAAHAFIAYKLGDRTAFYGGQVTLNPAPHIRREPMGMVVIPWVSYAAAGWMMGWASAPYDPDWAQLYPKRSAAMALGGPGANLLLALFAAVLIHLGLGAGIFQAPESVHFSQVVRGGHDGMQHALAVIVSILFSLNLSLLVFTLIPIAPLDGQAWMELLLRGNALFMYRGVMRHPSVRFFGIFAAWIVMNRIFPPIHLLALNGLYFFRGISYH